MPRRSFFEFLSYFTSDELETEKLREFASSEGQVGHPVQAMITDAESLTLWYRRKIYGITQTDQEGQLQKC